MGLKKTLNKLTNKLPLVNDIVLFVITNLLYSLMVFVLNLTFPVLFENQIFNKVVYIFQMVILMNSLSNFGISTSLLRNSVIDKLNSLKNAFFMFIIIQFIFFVLSFFKNNLITKLINLDGMTGYEHFMFYMSIISINVYLFNKSVMNSQKEFRLMLRNIFYLILIRVLSISIVYSFNITEIREVLFLIFVLPFIVEYVYFSRMIFRIGLKKIIKINTKSLKSFFYFSLRVFIVGSIFSLTDRLVIIKMKNVNEDITALLAFSFGFLGVISVLNFSFQNYFLNKINPLEKESVFNFLKKLKKYLIHYCVLVIGAITFICLIIYFLYAQINPLIYSISVILILKTAVTSYLGFKNILITSFDMLNYAVLINLLRFILVYYTLTFSDKINLIQLLIVISLIMIFCEYFLNMVVNFKLKNKYA